MANFDATRITVTEAASLVRNVYLPNGGAVLLCGPPGCGKSEIMARMMRDLMGKMPKFGACFYNLSAAQSVDVMGWPKITDGPLSLNGVPVWMQPVPQEGLRGAFPQLNPDDPAYKPIEELKFADLVPYPYGIAVFDEMLSVADDTVLLPLAQFMGEGRIGQWGVPAKKWARVGLTNRPSDHRDVRELHAHTRNRLARFEVHITWEDIVSYWESIGMSEVFRAFAGAEPEEIFSAAVPTGDQQFGTARSWTNAWKDTMRFCQTWMKLPNLAEKGQPYDPGILPVNTLQLGDQDYDAKHANQCRLLYAAIAARCGDSIATKFQDFMINMKERPTFEDVLADPMGTKMPEHAGVLYSMVEMFTTRTKMPQFGQVFKYARRMPRVMASALCVRMAHKHKLSVISNSDFMTFMDWCGPGARAAIYMGALGD